MERDKGMKLQIAVTCVLLAAGPGAAEASDWVRVGSYKGTTSYSDKTSIQKKGNVVSSLWLIDFQTPIKLGAGDMPSITTRKEFDCKKWEVRVLNETGYTRHMAEGKQIYAITEAKPWQVVIPGTANDMQFQHVCGRSG